MKAKNNIIIEKTILADKSTLKVVNVITTNLSVAIWLIDDYTQREPIGKSKVAIMEGNVKAIRNPSGYYVFNDLEAGEYEVIIESRFYFSEKIGVNIPHSDQKMPVIEITLTPKPSYPFPGYATLVRGVLSSTPQDVNPIVNEDLEVVGKSLKTKTDEKGEFVFYFKGVKKEDITIKIRNDKKSVGIVREGKKTNMEVITAP